MQAYFTDQIAAALDGAGPLQRRSEPQLIQGAAASLSSYYGDSELAIASVAAAGLELARLERRQAVELEPHLVLRWFLSSIRPEGWEMPPKWDPIAADYPTADGWIRLHTNAPAHRDAALEVLGTPAERAAVAEAVKGWSSTALESAIVAAGGASAAMHSLSDWARHPQGQAVASEPLIAWRARDSGKPPRNSLKGLRVLDLTRVLAGPIATRFLAGFGAEVLRIDPPFWDEPGRELEVTLGKRCAGLDLRTTADRATFEALLSKADVLVHGLRRGALEGLGYDEARRQTLSPGLIEVSLNAYGHSGPWSDRRGFDSLVQMSSGIADEGMRLSGGGKPVPLPIQVLDHGTGYMMAAAVIRALALGRETGQAYSARLSLARTAQCLIEGGTKTPQPLLGPETTADLSDATEHSDWGPARRLRFPITVDGEGPRWPHDGGVLRRHAPEWD